MKLLWILAAIVITWCNASLASGNRLSQGWGSYCGSQILPPGTWYRGLVDTYHRFAGSETNDRVVGCYYATRQQAEDTVRDTCRLQEDAFDGCYWAATFRIEKLVVPSAAVHTPTPVRTPTPVHTPPPEETRPGLSLHRYHSGCKTVHAFRTQECISAAHRYCMYTLGSGEAIAIPQEASKPAENKIAFLCAPPHRPGGAVPFSSIPRCKNGPQSPECYVDCLSFSSSLPLVSNYTGKKVKKV